MAINSKDIIRLTEIGEGAKDGLPLLEYRIATNLDKPMKVNQIYKIMIEKYPKDYIDGSLNFYKNIELLESKKIIEKVKENKSELDFTDFFNSHHEEVEMTTILSDQVDIIKGDDKKRRSERRKDRWFSIQKSQDEDHSLEITREKNKKFNYSGISTFFSKKDDDEIYMPINNPFTVNDDDKPLQKSSKKRKDNDVPKKLEYSSENKDGIKISLIESQEVKPKINQKDRTRERLNKKEREKYRKEVTSEKLFKGDKKKYKKLSEEENKIKLYFSLLVKKIKSIFEK